MLVARDAAGTSVPARRAHKAHAYWCRDCGIGVILRQGAIRIPHYAHPPGAPDCPGAHESAEHMAMKDFLYQVLPQQRWVTACALEHPLGTDPRQRADVWAQTDWGPIAFECQASPIGLLDLHQKLQRYTAQGIACFYLLHRNLVPGRMAGPLAQVVGQQRRIPMWVQGLYELYGEVYVYEHQADHDPQIFALTLADLPRLWATKCITRSRPIVWDEVTCAAHTCTFAGLMGQYRLALCADPYTVPPPAAAPVQTAGFPVAPVVPPLRPLPTRPGQLPLPWGGYMEGVLAPLPAPPPPPPIRPEPFAGIPVTARGNPPAVCPTCHERHWAWSQGWYCSKCDSPPPE